MAAADLLPDDVLDEILRRLAPSPPSLAACRVVCRAWCAVVDTRRPPPCADLFPLSLAGIFFARFVCPVKDFSGFFARRGRHHCARIISPKLDYLDDADVDYRQPDHCNGLLLMSEYIVNPATRRWARLPPTPEWSGLVGLETMITNCWGQEYLVFDPTVSPHYEVFSIPHGVFYNATAASVVRQHEWPPSLFAVRVYSSTTGRWEKRSLVRQGEAAGTIADVHISKMAFDHLYGVYWRGALYVQMRNNDVIRITLSDDKYRVIKSPSDLNLDNSPHIYLGRSNKGIYCASIHQGQYQHLQVWLLHEPHGDQMEYWMLIHDANLDQIMADFRWNPDHQALIRPWIQHDMRRNSKNNEEISSQDESGDGWDSEDDSIVYTEDMVGWGRNEYTCILGFHPFREIIFLYEAQKEVVHTYHLHNSKVEVLGTIYLYEFREMIGSSFPYTPCWIGDLS